MQKKIDTELKYRIGRMLSRCSNLHVLGGSHFGTNSEIILSQVPSQNMKIIQFIVSPNDVSNQDKWKTRLFDAKVVSKYLSEIEDLMLRSWLLKELEFGEASSLFFVYMLEESKVLPNLKRIILDLVVLDGYFDGEPAITDCGWNRLDKKIE